MFDTTDALLTQIRLGEDSALELKNLLYKDQKIVGPHREGMADELAAMANASNGVFVLGVEDKTRSIVGIPEDKLDAVETWIREICHDLIEPPLDCLIRKIPVMIDTDLQRVLIRIDIPRSLYVHQSPGGYFRRVGSSKRKLTSDYLGRLMQQRSQSRIVWFDEQAVPQAPHSCLDEDLWKKFKPAAWLGGDETFLLKLKLLTRDDDGIYCPSVSGVLMATKRPELFITNAFIQAVAYRGTERNAAYQLDAKDITGPLDVQISESYDFVRKNMKVYAVKEPARRDIPEYALQAVFEALVNAVAHRDYAIPNSKIRVHMFSDRLEIFSPGAIPNTMTIDSLSLRQATRNELLTSLLAHCPMPDYDFPVDRKHIMDKRGEGVPIILSESVRVSGRLPEYRLIDDAELMLTIFAARPPDLAIPIPK